MGGDGELDKQFTFEDVTRLQTLAALTPKEIRVIRLLDDGLTQSMIAGAMHVSRSYVSQTVTKLERHNLIKKEFPAKRYCFYSLSSDLKAKYQKEDLPRFTNCDTHYIKRKYRILHKSHDLSKDQRAGFLKSFTMRGWTGYKYWYPGNAGGLRIQIDVNPHSIVAYPDARQKVLVESVDQAEDKINMEIHNAVQKFVRDQAKFGVHIEVDEVGHQITPTHYAFPMSRTSPFATAGTTHPESWQDGSPQRHGEPDRVEYETTNKERATALDLAIDKVMAVDEIVEDKFREAMPEAMREFEKTISPLTSEIRGIMAYVQSGQTVQNQLQQLTFLVAKQLKDNHDLQDELSRIKNGHQQQPEPQQQPAATKFVSAYAPVYED